MHRIPRLVSTCFLLVLAGLLATGCVARGRAGGGDDDDDGSGLPGGGGGGPTGDLATGLSISKIAVYQGVEVLVMEDGDEANRNAPIVAGRPGILRVFVEIDSGFDDRDIDGYLQFEDNAVAAQTVTLDVDEDSRDHSLNSTFNFEIASFSTDLAFQVTLHETDGNSSSGSSADSIWPSSGYHDLDVESSGGGIEIVVIPVEYNADSSGRLPDTSDGQMADLADAIWAMYPTPDIELTVGNPMPWSQTIGANGSGWSDVLDGIMELRFDRGAAQTEYYYGMFEPASSLSNFCGGGCVSGLSMLAMSAGDDWARASVGLGYSGEGSIGTLLHEVGHAHGRSHSPCGLGGQQSDPSYPYSSAVIGVYGYDMGSPSNPEGGSLRDPNDNDVMSYCSPNWISDYQFEEIFDRVRSVNQLARYEAAKGEGTIWWTAKVDLDGARIGRRLDLGRPPSSGEERHVLYLDLRGEAVDSAWGRFVPYDHIDGGMVLFPPPPSGTFAVQVDDGVVIPL